MSSDSYTYLIKVDSNGAVVLPQLRDNATQADTSLRKIGGSSEKSFSTLRSSANRGNEMLRKTAGLLAGIGLTLSVGAMGTNMIRTGAQYEQSMSNVLALTNASKEEFIDLKAAAREAGATTAWSAKESADSMGYLAMAGFRTNQIIEALPATLNLASAGSMGLGRAADIASNILSQFQMKASETGRVVDQLAFTQANFNTNIEQLADGMNYLGPTASALNIPLSEVNATIGLLANNGLQGSLGTRTLSSGLIRLANPSKEMQRVMSDLNLSFFDATGNFVGMANMIGQLEKGFQGLTPQQKQAALATVFGTEAIKGMNILLSEGSENIRNWAYEIEGADGAARRMAEIKLDNLAGDFKILQSTAQEVAISIFEGLSPTLRSLTQEARLFVSSMDTTGVTVGLQRFALGLRNTLIWVRENRDLLIGIGKAYVSIRLGMMAYNAAANVGTLVTGAYTAALRLKGGAASSAALSVRGLNAAIMANPIGALIGLITAAATAFGLFRSKASEATEAQLKLNAARLEGEVKEMEQDQLVAKTQAASLQMNDLENFSDRQLRKYRDEASQRLERYEDMFLELQVRAGVQPHRYLELGKKWEKFDPDKDVLSSEHLEFISLRTKMDRVLSEVDTGKLSLEEMDRMMQRERGIVERTAGMIKEDDRPVMAGAGLQDFDEPIGAASEMSERVVTGGASQRIINISLGKFMENIIFNVAGMDEASIKDKAEQSRDMFMDNFLRVLNSANQMANG